jgi:hypothetical protein
MQEWICLAGKAIDVDGMLGPQTSRALHALDYVYPPRRALWRRLTLPMRDALSLTPLPLHLDPVKETAIRHLSSSPRELGQQNRGPWVRLYTGGKEGAEYPWCAAFATFVVHQAAYLTGRAPLVPRTLSCDELAASATLSPTPRVGAIFLRRRTAGDWDHCGIVVRVDGGSVATVEGNTNDEGAREGYEVCRRMRPIVGLDFITELLGPAAGIA